MEKEIKERLLNQELKVQRDIYMSKLYNNYVKLLYKKLELWFIRKKLCIIKWLQVCVMEEKGKR